MTPLRLFIALALAPELTNRLAELQTCLQSSLPANTMRWTAPHQIHLTLVFLGATQEQQLPQLKEVLKLSSKLPPFALHTSQLGAFPSLRRPSVLWCGVAGDLGSLNQLHAALSQRLTGLYPLDPRPFQPHLTLGRLRASGHASAVRQALESCQPPVLHWQVNAVRLMQSILRPSGAEHILLHEQALAKR